MRRLGIAPASAREQAQHLQSGGEGFQALPPRPAGALRRTSAELEIPASERMGRTFHVLADTGGVKEPAPQLAVSKAMAADLSARPDVAFAWHVGDIDYFTGEPPEYGPQFYEAYAGYNRHILGIPGNHDGEGGDQLAAFMTNLCASTPQLLPQFAEYNRDTITQPYCYWTLLDPAVTIIGLYSNVPSGGEIQADQAEWLAGELKAAPAGKPLIVSLHHPPYSIDAHHGGSQRMGELLDKAFEAAGRCPNIVLSGHVHDYQRFTRKFWEREITYLVVGNGGYHNLHELAPGATPGEEVTKDVVYEYGDASSWGFLRLTVESQDGVDNVIQGEYVQVAKDGTVTPGADKFTLNGPF
ncbi:MAG TPA: metallophosphoesterase [Solirubrobacteraceae bacterium]|jgi:3',5'-cyclic AMP phosphodiesterase CpdA